MTGGHEGDRRDDSQLASAANRGDVDAFEVLYRRHRDWAAALAYRFTRDRDDALDVLQDAFAYLLGKLPDLRLTSSLRAFLYPVIKHLSISLVRKRGRTMSADDVRIELAAPLPKSSSPSGQDPNPGNAGLRSELGHVMASLTNSQRETVLMRFLDDMSIREIAEALGIPEGTVKSRLHLALRKLRDDPRTRRYFEE